MESSSSRQAFTLASIIDAEKHVPPQRAHVLLASLAQARSVPAGPATVREWSEAIIVEREPGGRERAVFAGARAAPPAADRDATIARHLEAVRAAAVAMLWGRDSAVGPDGTPRYPRLRRLLVDHWDETRLSCEGPDKLLMFFDATLALDRAAEPKAGREAFKTLSIPTTEATRREVRVGTIGVPFEAIIDTGKFTKVKRAAPAEDSATVRPSESRWATPQVPTVAQSSSPRLTPHAPEPAARSTVPITVAIVAVVLLGALAFLFLR
jgi:hypothetical protein